MNQNKLNGTIYLFIWIIVFLLIIPSVIFSQTLLTGRVVNKITTAPVAYASIEIMKQKASTACDKSGNFSILVDKINPGDTMMISSIGYKNLKIPVSEAAKFSIFELITDSIVLEPVIFKSFSRRAIQGSLSSSSSGYNRSWNFFGNKGEIGRLFGLPYEEYQIDKVEFKVASFCDTCIIRLHIRGVENGMPGEEIITDSSAEKKGITVLVKSYYKEREIHEFDLSSYHLVTDFPLLFVGLEVVNCKDARNRDCSFSFAGWEKGKYIYRSDSLSNWTISSDDFTIFMKLHVNY